MDEKLFSKSQSREKENNIILEKRKKLNVTGVNDVDSFDTESIVLYTELGQLMVKGEELHIIKLSIDTGEVIIEGEIDSLQYGEDSKKSGGFFGRMFK